MADKVTKYYKPLYCLECGHYVLPEQMTGTPVEKHDCCPECGDDITFKERIGRFTYRQGRRWLPPFRKYFDITGFRPGVDPGKPRKVAKKVKLKRKKNKKR